MGLKEIFEKFHKLPLFIDSLLVIYYLRGSMYFENFRLTFHTHIVDKHASLI